MNSESTTYIVTTCNNTIYNHIQNCTNYVKSNGLRMRSIPHFQPHCMIVSWPLTTGPKLQKAKNLPVLGAYEGICWCAKLKLRHRNNQEIQEV